jgi:hypothetical protein
LKHKITLAFFLSAFSLSTFAGNICQKGDSIMISRFGKSFFKKHITLERLYCQSHPLGKSTLIENCADPDTGCNSYNFLYRISIPEKEINFEIQISLNKSRDSLYAPPTLPPLKLSRKQLNFLSKKEIEKIAYNRRFEEGTKPWRFYINWITKPYEEWVLLHQKEKIKKWGKGKFVWTIENWLVSSEKGMNGETIFFDAVTGEYLYTNMWIATP